MDRRSNKQEPVQKDVSTAVRRPGAAAAAERDDERELQALMVRYQAADSAAVEELVNRISPRLLRFFAGGGISRHDAEDMLQDCWLRIHRSRHTYRPSEPLLPWIFAVARHTRLDGYRKRQRLDSRELLAGTSEEIVSPAPGFAPQKDDFDGLLDGLPESQREVILMLKVAGMSLEEAARATSSTVGAVKQKAHRAYEKLRVLLAEKAR